MEDRAQQDIRIASRPGDSGRDAALAVGILEELRLIYRQKARATMMLFSRGNVLVSEGKVLTAEMIEARFR